MGITTNNLPLSVIVRTHTVVVNNHFSHFAIGIQPANSQPVFSIDPDSTWTEDSIKKNSIPG